MQTVEIRVCGDQWLNPDEVVHKLNELSPKDPVEFDMRTEGASLQALGIADVLNAYCASTGRDPKTFHITKWPNIVESLPFTVHTRSDHISHFFWLSDRYRPPQIIPCQHDFRFGFFVGRRSIARGVMLWQHWKKYQHQTLFSLMRTFYSQPYPNSSAGISVDQLQDWIAEYEIEDFVKWWSANNIPSLDSHSVQDQYNPNCNTNQDILAHYHRFDIEIVCETFTRGPSFFPTEKTIRPLCAGRPILAHAPKDFLKNLRSLGFETWHQVWDESYDSLEGPARWQAMQRVIDNISIQDQHQLRLRCQDICQHNHARVAELSTKRKPQ